MLAYAGGAPEGPALSPALFLSGSRIAYRTCPDYRKIAVRQPGTQGSFCQQPPQLYHRIMNTQLVETRPARQADAAALADVHAAAWRGAYRGLLDGLDLERLVTNRTPRWWSDALARGVNIDLLEVSGEVAGYATSGPCRMRGLATAGEIYELYLHPHYQGLGFGRQLFEAARRNLEDRRMPGLAVRVLGDNTPACGFYRAMGGRLTSRSWHTTGGRKLELLVYCWPARPS